MCVLGLGLIGGSVLRAAVAAGREAFGYNRSADGAAAADQLTILWCNALGLPRE